MERDLKTAAKDAHKERINNAAAAILHNAFCMILCLLWPHFKVWGQFLQRYETRALHIPFFSQYSR